MQDLTDVRDTHLIRRLSQGDEGAFLEFYRRHQASIYRYALHMTGRPESAADVVQETFLTLIRNAGKFDKDKGAPGAFLYGIAHNHVRKLYEKEKRFVAMGEEEFMEDEGSRWERTGTAILTGIRPIILLTDWNAPKLARCCGKPF